MALPNALAWLFLVKALSYSKSASTVTVTSSTTNILVSVSIITHLDLASTPVCDKSPNHSFALMNLPAENFTKESPY